MAGVIRLLGSAFILLWIALTFFGHDVIQFIPQDYKKYSGDLFANKWLILALGIILSVIGSFTRVNKALNKNKNKKKQNIHRSNIATDFVDRNETDDKYNQNSDLSDYIDKHQQNSDSTAFANTLHGRLKETALKVDWTPMSSGGANFKTATLKQINSTRLEVHMSKGGYLFAGVFALFGFGTMILGSYSIIKADGIVMTILFPILFGALFAGISIAMILLQRTRVIDIRYGWYWSGDKTLVREQDFMRLKHSARLSDISAIQILAERLSKNKGGSYTSWEINLVSKEGKRLNVMDHGNKENIDRDAKAIGELLGVPIWENN